MISATSDISASLFIENTAVSHGGAIYMNFGQIRVTRTTFLRNEAFGQDVKGHHIYAASPIKFYVAETSFDPYADEGNTRFINLNVLAGCAQFPCKPGYRCSYERYSLQCTACPQHRVGRTGLTCDNCGPGTGPTLDQHHCQTCDPGRYSDVGVCQECKTPYAVTVFSQDAVKKPIHCGNCPAGSGRASEDIALCSPCIGRNYSMADGVCKSCPDGKRPLQPGRTQCEACAASESPSTDGQACECAEGYFSLKNGSQCVSCHVSVLQDGLATTGIAWTSTDSPSWTDTDVCPGGPKSEAPLCPLPGMWIHAGQDPPRTLVRTKITPQIVRTRHG